MDTAAGGSYARDDFVGQSWIVSPEGDILAETTAEAPIVSVDIDVREATSAKRTYPRNLALGGDGSKLGDGFTPRHDWRGR